MAEESNIRELDDKSVMSRDDMSALDYVLKHVKGSSPSSMSLLQLEEMSEE